MRLAPMLTLALLLAACGDDGGMVLDNGGSSGSDSGVDGSESAESGSDSGDSGSDGEATAGGGSGDSGMVDPPECLGSPTMAPTCALLTIDTSMLPACDDLEADFVVDGAVFAWGDTGRSPDDAASACETTTHIVQAGEYHLVGMDWEIASGDVRWRCTSVASGDANVQNGREETLDVYGTEPGGWEPRNFEGIDRECCVLEGSPTNPEYVTDPC